MYSEGTAAGIAEHSIVDRGWACGNVMISITSVNVGDIIRNGMLQMVHMRKWQWGEVNLQAINSLILQLHPPLEHPTSVLEHSPSHCVCATACSF